MKKSYLAFMALTITGCANSPSVDIKGKIGVYGSSPHTYLAIRDSKSHKHYKIVNSKDFNLDNMQNKILEVNAKIIKQKVGPGFPAVIEVIRIK